MTDAGKTAPRSFLRRPGDDDSPVAAAATDARLPIVNAEQVTGWSDLCCRDHVDVQILGRLKPGVTMAQATGTLNAMAKQMAKEDPKDDGLMLGAQRMQVLRAVLRRPAILLLIGSGIGVGAGLMTTRVLAHLISFPTPHDPLVLAGVLLTMILLGMVASWIPARRALKIDPARLLRE